MYGTRFCGYCLSARRLLESKGVPYEDIRVDEHPERRRELDARGLRTVPQIWIGERHIGGFDEMWALDRAGELDRLLEAS
jgi:glutaredoxin 3